MQRRNALWFLIGAGAAAAGMLARRFPVATPADAAARLARAAARRSSPSLSIVRGDGVGEPGAANAGSPRTASAFHEVRTS